MSTTIRKQAPRPARPAGRYWKGKAPKGAADLSSSDESDDAREVPQEEGDVAFAGEQEFLHAEYDGDEEEEQGLRAQGTGKMSVALKNVNISKEGKVLIDGRQEVGRTEMEGALSCPPPPPPPIITDNYDNHLEPSEETEEELDAEAASQGETDDVSQPAVCNITLSKGLSYDSLAQNQNQNQKRRNLRFNSGPFSFQSEFSAHDDPTRFSHNIPFLLH